MTITPEQAIALAAEHGDFVAMRAVDDELFEPFPAVIRRDGNLVVVRFGTETYIMRSADFDDALDAVSHEREDADSGD